MDLKNNQGILFENKKEKDTQPDFKGELNINGDILRVAMWEKTSKNGNHYISLQVEKGTKKDIPSDKSSIEHKDSFTQDNDLDDDIPFN